MKARMTPLTVALSLMAATAYAADPNLGTWKLDESKSKFPADSSKLTTVVDHRYQGRTRQGFQVPDRHL